MLKSGRICKNNDHTCFSCINICLVPKKLFEHEAVKPSVQTSSQGPGTLYLLNFAIEHAQKKIVMFIRIRHTCVALIHKKTVLSLETSSEIHFEFIKGALAWYGKLTWESAHAWNLMILCLLIV